MAKEKIYFDVDNSQVLEMLKEFTGKDARKAIRTALRRTASAIAKATKQNLKSRIPAAKRKSKKYSDTLLHAVKFKVDKDKEGNYFFKTHIMGTRRHGSGTFRTRFFEGGTKERHKRGSIKPHNFFEDAVNSRKNQFKDDLDKEIKQVVAEINAKKRA